MLTIGRLAKLSGVGTDAIRYYEREGLLTPACKTEAGYRLYTDDARRRLAFIKHAQRCGFSLAEIHELLTLRTHDDACCADVRSAVVQKKLQIENKIKTLRAMSAALSELIDIRSAGERSLDACPILAALENDIASKQLGH